MYKLRFREEKLYSEQFSLSQKFNDAEFMQNLFPVGFGPSLKTCPKWAPHRAHMTSVLVIPCNVSVTDLTLPLVNTS